ncbi:MAG: hypothetical protein KKF48_03500 [Nanoarchaeota archaeon]|nr:hypothetical protein [Nanoarchaeota archaeon]MBU1028085.1 hypothetical protein [Nanoarchaeota archaeon]
MEKEHIEFLNQIVNSVEEAGIQLEQAYNSKNSEKFNKAKKFILQVQKKINGEIK